MTLAEPAQDRIDLARRVANILGPNSGAGLAVRRYDQLREAGYPARIVMTKTMWMVEETAEPLYGMAAVRYAFKRDAEEE